MCSLNQFRFRLSLFGIVLVLLGTSCKRQEMVTFEGYAINFMNEGLPGTEIEINGVKTQTDKTGFFTLNLEKSNKNHFQVNARKDGYATYSQTYPSANKNLKLILYEATVVSVDPSKEIIVTDINNNKRPGSFASRTVWTGNPLAAVPLKINNGSIVDIGFTPEFEKAFAHLLNRKPGPGISITIPANTLVGVSDQQSPTGKVNVSISTIDLFSPDAMPGDFAVIRNGSETGFLISYGAGFIDVYDDKNRYQLKKGSTAKISIPVDSSQLVFNNELPSTIPVYLFDEKSGAWTDDTEARLNASRNLYEAEVSHFSTFNLDIEKTNPACLSFKYAPSTPAVTGYSYHVEALVPIGGNIIKKSKTITEPGDCMADAYNTGTHALVRLPSATEVCLVFIDNSNKPMTILITESSNAYVPASPPTCTIAGYENADGSVSCPSLSWNVVSDNIIAVGVTSVGIHKVKWVYKDHASGASYRIVQADGACNPINTTNVASSQSETPLITSTILSVVEAIVPGPGTYRVQALDAGSNVLAQSFCITL